MSTTSRVVASRQTMFLLNKEHRLSAGNDSRLICTLRLADRLFDVRLEERFEVFLEKAIVKPICTNGTRIIASRQTTILVQ